MASAVMKSASVKAMLHTYWPAFRAARKQTMALDAWVKGTQYDYTDDSTEFGFGRPYSPKGEMTDEYQNLSEIAPNAFGGLVVKTLAQTAYIKGMKLPGNNDNLEAWDTWQQNRMDSKQVSIFRAAIGHGAAFGLVLPGTDPLTGAKMAKISGRSLKRMSAFYDEDDDEWPRMAIDAKPYEILDPTTGGKSRGWNVTLIDDTAEHFLTCEGDGWDRDSWVYISYTEHGFRVCPVARCANSLDLDGRATGEIEPIIPLLRRIDQDVFDRLIVQRFGAWAIRYITGMSKPTSAAEEQAQKLALSVADLLIAEDPNAKIGAIPGTPLDGFTNVTDADLRILAAITQTPPHHLLGMSANMQAEALDAAEQGLKRKSTDFKMHAGEFAEQLMRLAATVKGNRAEASAFNMQTVWADTEAQSFQSTAQALGMVATNLGVPVEMLWERLPNWTDSDTERAKALVEDGTFQTLVQSFMAAGAGANANQNPPAAAASSGPAE